MFNFLNLLYNMELDKLRITRHMGNEPFVETDWAHVAHCKYLRLTSCSDTNITIEIIFSFDKNDLGPTAVMRQTKNQWCSRRIDIQLDYMKIRVINDTPSIPNNFLLVNPLGRTTNTPTPDLPLVSNMVMPRELISQPEYEPEDDMITHHDEGNQELRSKSPFKSILKNIKETVSRGDPNKHIHRSMSSERLPSYIPKHSLLIGGYRNQIICVPPPASNVTSFLVFRDNQFTWQEINEEDNKRVSWQI